MSEEKLTIGRAIDQVIEALSAFDDPADQKTILAAVCAHLKITVPTATTPQLTASTQGAANFGSSEAAQVVQSPRMSGIEQGTDIKTLKNLKQPSSARQMAALVAFYLSEVSDERRDVITTADLDKYFKQAGYKLPEKLEQLLADSKKSGYFESAGRGEYKLTRVGYNLVVHSMPAKEKG